MEYGKTRMNDRGEIVLPANLRGMFNPGEVLFVIRENDTIIIKKSEYLEKKENEYDNRYATIKMRYDDLIDEMEPF